MKSGDRNRWEETIRKNTIALGDRYNQMNRPEPHLFILKLAFQRK